MAPKNLVIQDEVTKIIETRSYPTLESKIDLITTDVSKPYMKSILKKLACDNPKNATIICDYIIAEQIERNIKPSTKEGKIKVLVWLSNHNPSSTFDQLTKGDILDYLNSLRKTHGG